MATGQEMLAAPVALRALAAAGRGDRAAIDLAERALATSATAATAAVASVVSAAVGRGHTWATPISPVLASWPHRIVLGFGGHVLLGPAAMFRGLALVGTGDDASSDRAARLELREATALARTVGAGPWLAMALRAEAQLLQVSDPDRASSLREQADAVCVQRS